MNPELPSLPLFPATIHPQADTRAILYFGDGAIRVGVWNGKEWSTDVGPASPINWQGLPAWGLN